MTTTSVHITSYFWLLLISFVVALLTRRARIPYALALVITGLVIGIPHLLPQAHLDPNLLFTVFLPPLLFESAINLRLQSLRRDWKPIAIYTLAGTLASTFVVGGLTAWALHVPLPSALVFGALISATDPIAVIAIFKRLGAGTRLTLIIEAESLFNDGVAAVLFGVALTAATGSHISFAAGLWAFFKLVIGGILFGVFIGGLASRVHYELEDHLVEITLTTVVAFGSYLCAEALHVSGVIAVVAAGMVIGNYGMPNTMSPGTRLAVVAFWEYAAFTVNSIVFLLIGIEVAYVRWLDRIGLAFGAIIAVLIGRAAIYPMSLLVNRLKGEVPVSWQHVLFWGGLRGALSMALVLGLNRDFPQRDTLVAATFGVVLFSLLLQGSTVGPLIRRLGLAGAVPSESDDRRRVAAEIVGCRAALAELDRIRAAEAHPVWGIEALTRQYRAQLDRLAAEMEAIEPGHNAHNTKQVREAHRSALIAEKSALYEAQLQGHLHTEDWAELAARIDSELVALCTTVPDH